MFVKRNILKVGEFFSITKQSWRMLVRTSDLASKFWPTSFSLSNLTFKYLSKVNDKIISHGLICLIFYRRAGYKTWHKIVVRSSKQPFRGKNVKKRGLVTNHFWNENLKWGLLYFWLRMFFMANINFKENDIFSLEERLISHFCMRKK